MCGVMKRWEQLQSEYYFTPSGHQWHWRSHADKRVTISVDIEMLIYMWYEVFNLINQTTKRNVKQSEIHTQTEIAWCMLCTV